MNLLDGKKMGIMEYDDTGVDKLENIRKLLLGRRGDMVKWDCPIMLKVGA